MKKTLLLSSVLCSVFGVLLLICMIPFLIDRPWRWTQQRVQKSKVLGTQLVQAIEQYRNDKGKAPEELTLLVPDYIAKIESPPAGTGEWKYMVKKNGFDFRLYCHQDGEYPSLNYDSEYSGVGWYVDN